MHRFSATRQHYKQMKRKISKAPLLSSTHLKLASAHPEYKHIQKIYYIPENQIHVQISELFWILMESCIVLLTRNISLMILFQTSFSPRFRIFQKINQFYWQFAYLKFFLIPWNCNNHNKKMEIIFTYRQVHYVRFSRFYWRFEILNRKTGW